MTAEPVATDQALLSTVAAERREQGLDPVVTDPGTLRRIAALVLSDPARHLLGEPKAKEHRRGSGEGG